MELIFFHLIEAPSFAQDLARDLALTKAHARALLSEQRRVGIFLGIFKSSFKFYQKFLLQQSLDVSRKKINLTNPKQRYNNF